MANSLSAKKRIRQNITRRSRNRWRIRQMRMEIKSLQAAIASGDVAQAEQVLRTTSQIIDRTAQKGVIHRNQAARRKARLSAAVRKLKVGAAA